MSEILNEAAGLYKEILDADVQLTAMIKDLKTKREEKNRHREEKIDEFIKTQIIPAAERMSYATYGMNGLYNEGGGTPIHWDEYKNRDKTVTRSTHFLFLFRNNVFYDKRLNLIIHSVGEIKVELEPLPPISWEFPQVFYENDKRMRWSLDLSNPQESLQKLIKKYETELLTAPRDKYRHSL